MLFPYFTSRPLYEGIPGTVTVQIEVFQEENRRSKREGSGKTGISLAQLRQMFGGDEGEMADPYHGKMHRISLRPWDDADAEKTFLHITFRFVPEKPRTDLSPELTQTNDEGDENI